MSTTIDVQTIDDTHVQWSGGAAWALDSASVRQFIGYNTSNAYKCGGGYRFMVNIAQGETIITAYITFQATYNRTGTVVKAYIVGEDVDDAAAFSNIANYQGRRGTVVGGANDNNITTAKVDWDPIAAWSANQNYNTPEIKTIIQEIVDRPGKVPNQHMVIFVDDHDGRTTQSASTVREPKSIEEGNSHEATLHIEYGTSAAPGPSSVARFMAGGLL